MRLPLNPGKLLKEGLLYGVLLIILANVVSYIQSPEIDEGTPPLSGVLIDGTPVSLKSYRGEPLVLHFWASWCPTCKLEAPAIDSLAKEYPVLTVAVDSGSDEAVQEFLNEKGYTFGVLNDHKGDLKRAFKVKALPTTFVLDPEGEILFSEVGYTSGIGLRLRMYLAR